ncbi:hypothetical protein GCM10028807_03800 [Spirosoma daeguense]
MIFKSYRPVGTSGTEKFPSVSVIVPNIGCVFTNATWASDIGMFDALSMTVPLITCKDWARR